jgi:hypothetical protein
MEALQRETGDLLAEPPTRARTRRLGRLRRSIDRAAAHDVTARQPIAGLAESLLNGFEQELSKRIRVLLQRIEVPSREEVDRLAERVTALEEEVRSTPRDRREARSARRIAKS